jgi:hypothetical protein
VSSRMAGPLFSARFRSRSGKWSAALGLRVDRCTTIHALCNNRAPIDAATDDRFRWLGRHQISATTVT